MNIQTLPQGRQLFNKLKDKLKFIHKLNLTMYCCRLRALLERTNLFFSSLQKSCKS
uniref:Uncharacterized protein n=1 Tax=Rhizophora mucronata TaxID=61149 RepID=A0A2P2N5K1_RHIMU